jgi:1-acyl-sn-glycerol-3-phosphate acyltransferase
MTGVPNHEAPHASTSEATSGVAPDTGNQAERRDRPSEANVPGAAGTGDEGKVPGAGGTSQEQAKVAGAGGTGDGGEKLTGLVGTSGEEGRITGAVGAGDGEPEVVGAHGAAPGAGTPGGQGNGRRAGKNPERGYLIAAVVVKPLMRTWFRIRLEGEEHIPPVGPVILASNHRSNMDPVLLASALRRPVAFMAKAELFVGPLGWILRWIGQFPVRRGGIDREALRQTDAVLARGSMLGLFPEGTRGDGQFSAVHPGLAYIVVRQRRPVLPVVIFGTDRVRRRFGWLPFASPVRIVIGPAIDLPQSTSDRAGRRAASQLLQQRLQAFLALVGGDPTAQSINSQSDE